VAFQAGLLREAAPVRLAYAPAVQHDLVAGLPVGVVARFDGTRAVDPGDHRPAAHDGRAIAQCKAVLVVQRRMRGAYDDVAGGSARGKLLVGQLADGRPKTAVVLLQIERTEGHLQEIR